MKKTRKRKIVIILLLVMAIAFLACLTYINLLFVDSEHSHMVENQMNVQDKLYESVDMYFVALQLTVLSSTLLVLVVFSLIRVLCSPPQPDRLAWFFGKHGRKLALFLTLVFVLLVLIELNLLYVIQNTPEIDETPATLFEHHASGILGIISEIVVLSILVSFLSWRREKKREQASQALERKVKTPV